jgi:hypothetical protein
MEYIVQEFTEKYGWCLFRLAGAKKEHAEQVLKKAQLENPDKQLRLEEVESKDCWWNDPFLCN